MTKLSVEELAADYIGEIRSIQPNGPYFLLGYSFGGLVAYEMARQLSAQGERIALLAMVDTYNLRKPWFRTPPIHLRLYRRLVVHKNALKKHRLKGKVGYGWRTLAGRVQRTLSESSSPLMVEPNPGTMTLESAYEQMTHKYTPQAYPGQVILFRTIRPPEDLHRLVSANTDAFLGWSKLIDRLEVYDLPCDHFNVVFEPFVQQLATGLQTYLDLAQVTHSIEDTN